MANDVPTSRTPADPGDLMAGQGIRAARVQPLLDASNFITAHIGSGTPRISQTFPRRGSGPTGVLRYTSGASALVCRWDIPDTRGETSVDCYIVGSSVGGGGTVEFRSLTAGAVTAATAIPSAKGLVGPLALTIDTSSDDEQVGMYLDATGGAIVVDSVLVVVPPKSSPLPAGIDATGCVAFDASELQADEPLSADIAAALRANLAAARDVPHVYWNWSGMASTVAGADAAYMRAIPHCMTAPVWMDADREAWDLDVRATALRTGDDQHIRLFAATGPRVEDIVGACEILVASGASGLVRVSGTLRVSRRRVLTKTPRGVDSILLWMWPEMLWPGVGDIVAAQTWWQRQTGGDPTLLTTAKVTSLAVWGK